MRSALKGSVKDGLAIMRQAFGLPHNKTRAQMRSASTACTAEIDEARISVICTATGQPADTVRALVEEFAPPGREDTDFVDVWDQRGGRPMSHRDRLTLHVLVNSLQPVVCVETGTAAGASAAVILAALERRGVGQLISIDQEGPYVAGYGELIPQHLRARWSLYLQPASGRWPVLVDELPWPLRNWLTRHERPVLPEVLCRLGTLDFFLHDSRHTFRHMRWEYELAWQSLASGSCLASHDVLATSAFDDFRRAHRDEILASGVVGNFGFCLKR
jgi:hypothetical protein